MRGKLHSIIPLERVNVVGILPYSHPVSRLIRAPMVQKNGEWAVSCRYMPVERLTALCDDPNTAGMIATQ